ncbi:MAG: 50S ribosomal protein L10 [Armatimonadetes bacterium CG2_30_59_28]|nr:50S ribosomal protein L10 [Armatimonadota bacterium]OIO92960.1 MAG: 50S ribosomal protein L10 [Armatimonadetes bacterium CG2_30_59_28]PIU65051.1 MAG: 50S ribosomal protein L10 [Armatimonadetes bacterium CG07_land_8_20_14_0_80_59_28]PIX40293.1 MAG: 50S ribosomal protein L10 [Armatimonadetes bacterium CG_4_8_14_3_um_filter_58_9]PIY43366.1 MAG: 50S ribosomal protein L10 [Armatimonadetes bacterium CG_4_10_14_3_um_filter_59_10]PJB74868.1 MAG: 50S ribosomal protein L10 [Armatimonadetes bacterium 
MARPEKAAIVEGLRSNLDGAAGLVLADYRGITAQQMTALRRRARDTGAKFQVVKNTLFRRAVEGIDAEPLAEQLTGPLAVAFGFGDPVELIRLMADLGKEYPSLEIRSGFVDRRIVEPTAVLTMAKLPGRQDLLASVVGSLQAPIYGLVSTLGGVVRNLVYTLHAVKEQKQSG